MEAKFPRPEEGELGKPGTFFSGCNQTGTRLPGGVGKRCLSRRQQRPPGCRSEQDSLSSTQEAFPSLLSPTPTPSAPLPSPSIQPEPPSLPPAPALGNAAPPAPPPPRSYAEVTGGVPRVGFHRMGTGVTPRLFVPPRSTWQ